MTKYLIILGFALFALVGFGYALSTILTSGLDDGQTKEPPVVTTQFPGGSPAQEVTVPISTNTFDVTTKDGAKIRVYDVRNDADTQRIDTDTGGIYYLLSTRERNLTHDEQGYSITFWQTPEVFNVTLTGEPNELRQKEAEQDLFDRLKITQPDFCRLRFAITAIKDDGTYIEKPTLYLCSR